MELGRESMRGKCTGKIVKCWYRIMCLDIGDPVRQYYEGRRVWEPAVGYGVERGTVKLGISIRLEVVTRPYLERNNKDSGRWM